MTARARQAIPARDDSRLAQLYRHVTEQQAARFSAGYDLPAGQGRYARWLHQQGEDAGDWDADRAVTALYGQHYRALVGLAALLVRDVPAAQELVQDSFVALHAAWPELRDHDRAVFFLQRAVTQGSRTFEPGQQAEPAEPGGVMAALRALPPRQREAVVLRCCTGLPDSQIAAAMGVSRTSARDHTARAMAALHAAIPADGGALQIWQGEPG